MARMNDTMRLKQLQKTAQTMQTNNERMHLALVMLFTRSGTEYGGFRKPSEDLVFEAEEIEAALTLIQSGFGIVYDGTGDGSGKKITIALRRSEPKQTPKDL